MKLFCTLLALLVTVYASANTYDTLHQYALPDSIKAVAFMADVSVGKMQNKSTVGIATADASLVVAKKKNQLRFQLRYPSGASVIARGLLVRNRKMLEWKLKRATDTTFKLLFVTAIDSTDHFTITSGYVFFPLLQEWKLLGTWRVNNSLASLQSPGAVSSIDHAPEYVKNVWVQKSIGGWKQLDDIVSKVPSINPMPNIDSVAQYKIDQARILAAVSDGKTDLLKDTAGVYYKIIDEGKGQSFTVADTVTVKYQLRIFGTVEVISGNETETYTFPLKNLIKAWQIAVPLVKAGGGKIKLVIPSGLGYSIRTRASRIPPNSILEFNVEVIDVKPSK